jgi:hypothetical protein
MDRTLAPSRLLPLRLVIAGGVALGALGSSGCAAPTSVEPRIQEGANLLASGEMRTEILVRDRVHGATGETTILDVNEWRLQQTLPALPITVAAQVTGGVARLSRTAERPMLSSDTAITYGVPDSTIADLVPVIAYTQAAFSAPIDPSEQSESWVVVDSASGAEYRYEVQRGTVGQYLRQKITRTADSFMVLDAQWTWGSDGAGGLVFQRLRFWAYTDSVLVRTTLTMTNATSWFLTQGPTQPLDLTRALAGTGSRLASFVLPPPLCAQGLSIACRAAMAAAGFSAAANAAATYWFAITRSPAAAVAWISTAGATVAATFGMRSSCPRK